MANSPPPSWVSAHDRDLDVLVPKIQGIFRAVFGREWESGSLSRALSTATDVKLLLVGDRAEAADVGGYALYEVADLRPHHVGLVLWERSIAVIDSPTTRGRGFGTTALLSALATSASECWPNSIVGRTQNPLVMRRYRKLSNGPVVPFDADPDTRHLTYSLLKQHFKPLWTLDEATGICREAYRQRFGSYPLLTDRQAQADEAWLAERGFNRDRGDAVVVVAPIRHQEGDRRHVAVR